MTPDGKKIAIIADDDADSRRLMASVVRRAGFEVQEAADGQEALELCRMSAPPDLILTDLMMPRCSGLGVLESVRSALPKVPVVVVSAVGSIDMELLALELGAAAMVHKPFDCGALRELVSRVVAAT